MCVVYQHNTHVRCVHTQHTCVVYVHSTHVYCVHKQHTCVLCMAQASSAPRLVVPERRAAVAAAMGKVHGSLARAGKVKNQTPKVAKFLKKVSGVGPQDKD